MYLNCPNSSGQETSDTEPLKKYSTVKTGLFANFVKLNSLFADSGRWAFLAVTHPNTLEDDLVRYASLKEADPLFVKMALANLARRSLASGALAS